jgi:hypothetical protein
VASLGRRLQATADALASALRDRLPAPAPGLDEVRVPMPDDLWAARAGQDTPVARYHELDTVLEEAEVLFRRMSETEPLVLGTGAPLPRPRRRRRPCSAGWGGARGRCGGAVAHGGWQQTRRRPLDQRLASQRQPARLAHRRGPGAGGGVRRPPGPLIFTSATLSTRGSAGDAPGAGFSYLRERLGLADTASEAVFPSPFNYHEQALLYLATDLPDPTLDSYPAAAAGGCWSWPGLARAGAAAVHQLPQPAPVRGAVPAPGRCRLPAAGAGRATAPRAAGFAAHQHRVGAAGHPGLLGGRRRARARRCRWWRWTACPSPSPPIR